MIAPLDLTIAPAAPEPPHLGHRPLQHAVPVLHAGGRSTSGCRGSRSSPSRRSTGWPASSPASACDKVRLTGGEPLLRHDLPTLVGAAGRARAELDDIALTTNGILLGRHAAALRAAGLRRVTVSLDTLRPERMVAFARSARHGEVLGGHRGRPRGGFESVKLNTRGHSRLQRRRDARPARVRPGARARGPRSSSTWTSGGATRWSHGPGRLPAARSSRPSARRYGAGHAAGARTAGRRPSASRLPDGTVVRRHRLTTAPFCRTCDRARLTADGTLLLCLYGERGLDLRELLRRGRTDEEIAARIAETWATRTDRGAEERAALADRGVLHQIESLRADPRREMHTRGG